MYTILLTFNLKSMKKIVILLFVAVAATSCASVTIIPKAVNTVNSVSLSELNLDREDYDVLNTATSEATIIYREKRRQIEIFDAGNEFSISYQKTRFGWLFDESTGIMRLGFLTNDYEDYNVFAIQPEELARRLAIYRLINVSKLNGADGIIEPVISTNIEQQGKDIIFKTTVSAKMIKLHTNE